MPEDIVIESITIPGWTFWVLFAASIVLAVWFGATAHKRKK